MSDAPQIVWIVEHWEDHAPGWIEGVYATLDEAKGSYKLRSDEQWRECSDGTWELGRPKNHLGFQMDGLSIEPHEVKGLPGPPSPAPDERNDA